MENLAPAGSMEALERAVAAGADAVYLGYAAFSARAGAGNFDSAQLAQAVDYCHLHGVRVHVTVNTLIKDGELAEVGEVLSLLNRLRVDGVLVQDLAVADMLRTRFPDLPVHASTQMALHNVSGVRFARTLGCVRVVLARECGLDVIRESAAATVGAAPSPAACPIPTGGKPPPGSAREMCASGTTCPPWPRRGLRR